MNHKGGVYMKTVPQDIYAEMSSDCCKGAVELWIFFFLKKQDSYENASSDHHQEQWKCFEKYKG